MAEKTGVFVSHHHSPEEDAFTARLVVELEAAGADVWVDTGGITSGSLVAKISTGLAQMQWLVLVMTPASLASEWIRLEVDTAIAEHRAGRMLGIIPLVMLPCKEADIPLLWRTFLHYDATKGYEAGGDGLMRAMGLTLPSTKVDAPAIRAEVNQNFQRLDIARLKTLDGLRSLTAWEFHDAVAWMLAAHGYKSVKSWGLGSGGFTTLSRPADLTCESLDGQLTDVWCITNPVASRIFRQELVAAILHKKVSPMHQAMFVTMSSFTVDAYDWANDYGVRVIDGG
jgi:hypothetical protein